MSDLNLEESWQVDAQGQIYDGSFAELADWIAEGSLLPDDLVRRGSLRWIEARKVPKLVEFFNAKQSGTTLRVTVTTPAATTDEITNDTAVEAIKQQTKRDANAKAPQALPSPAVNLTNVISNAGSCANHSDREAAFICQTCKTAACRECVQSFGSSVRLCAACGAMCKPKGELEAAQRTEVFRDHSIEKGFGLGDLREAIVYPFKFKASLIFGALMFMFFSVARMAWSFGGIYMLVGAIFAYMLSNMLAFGILSNTIDRFAQGQIGKNFMPDFDDFSMWDSVVQPFFLSVGVWISSFGPFIAVFLIGSFMIMNSVNAEMDTVKTNLANTPGTPYYGVRDTMDQSEQVKSLLGNSERINQQHLDAQQDIENGKQPAAVNQEEENVQGVNKMIADSKRQELESVVGKTPETRERESSAFLAGFLKLAAPIVVVGFIALLWGLFFFPAACTVAGYTQSFTATVNPLVGLDTIKHLGVDYAKILLMSLLLLVVFGIVSIVFAAMFSVFDLPGIGNVPARALESIVWFYLVIVFACILGFAIFKASDRLQLRN